LAPAQLLNLLSLIVSSTEVHILYAISIYSSLGSYGLGLKFKAFIRVHLSRLAR